jgi:RNA polymerase sigma-70 factor (ECF subfamily)
MRARRRRNDGQAHSEDGEFDAAQTIPGKDPDPERLALSGQMKERVEAAMETLSSMERTAFVLRHFEGISIEDIGQTLRIQPNAAKNTVFRAVRKLRLILEPFTEAAR